MNTCTSSDMLYSNWGLLTKGTAGTQLLAQNSDVCQDKELNRVHKQTLLIGGGDDSLQGVRFNSTKN